jgi:hypothetical protein
MQFPSAHSSLAMVVQSGMGWPATNKKGVVEVVVEVVVESLLLLQTGGLQAGGLVGRGVDGRRVWLLWLLWLFWCCDYVGLLRCRWLLR